MAPRPASAGSRKFVLPGPVSAAYFRSRARFTGIMGPPGSAKSSTSAQKLFAMAKEQRAVVTKEHPRGIRKCRTLVLRRTDAELQQTTIRTWLKWFPEGDFGRFYWSSPYVHEVRVRLPDGSFLEWDVIFWAVDRPDKTEKLGSFEVTNAWLNEARELPFEVLEKVDERINRYPSLDEGGPVHPCVIADTNAPNHEHWWAIIGGYADVPKWMADEEALKLRHSKGREFFRQPPAVIEQRDGAGRLTGYEVNPQAENLGNLAGDYYPQLMENKSRAYIRVQLQNELGQLGTNRSVHQDFIPDFHVARAPLAYDPRVPIIAGMDFGRNPTVVFGQVIGAQKRILAELPADGMGTDRFVRTKLLPFVVQTFPQVLIRGRDDLPAHLSPFLLFRQGMLRIWGDPAGDTPGQTDDSTPFMILRAAGFDVLPSPTNNPAVRLQAVDQMLCGLVGREPELLIDPSCTFLIGALAGGYVFRQLPSGMYDEQPLKNRHSHIADALQYLCLGAGGGLRLLHGTDRAATVRVAEVRRNPLGTFGAFRGGGSPYERARR